jgi:hypothetical protein
LKKERKGIAARHFQLLTGHAIIAPFLKERLTQMNAGGAINAASKPGIVYLKSVIDGSPKPNDTGKR